MSCLHGNTKKKALPPAGLWGCYKQTNTHHCTPFAIKRDHKYKVIHCTAFGRLVCRPCRFKHWYFLNCWWLMIRSCKAFLSLITLRVPVRWVRWGLNIVPPTNTRKRSLITLRCESFVCTQLHTQWSWMRIFKCVMRDIGSQFNSF